MPSFENDVLNKRSSEIKEAPLKPVGQYLWLIVGPHVEGESSQKKTKWLGWNIKCMGGADDSTNAAIAEYEANCQSAGLQNYKVTDWSWKPSTMSGCRFWVTEDAVIQLKTFLINALSIDEGTKTLREMLAEAPGKQFYQNVGHRPSQDGTRMFNELQGTAAKV